MTGFSVPRVAIRATLLQTSGGKRGGEIYVMERVPQHAGHETPLDMLNRAEGFFPFRPQGNGGGVLLVAKGRATLELPQHHSRLLDYLNASPEPFFTIATADEVHLVNRAHVLYARPED